MAFDFRDAQQIVEKSNQKFQVAQVVTPCVTCTATGQTANANGDSLSATVSDEPDYIWVLAYGDSIPFVVLNLGRVIPQTGLSIKVGYDEAATERVVLGYNNDVLPPTTSSQQVTEAQDPNSTVLRDFLATLRTVVTAGTLTITVYGMEYNRFGAREGFPTATLDLSSYVPSAGSRRWVLVYLNAFTRQLAVKTGVIGPDLATQPLPKPNTPLFGFGTVYVLLTGGDTEIAESSVEDARTTLYPNKVSGVVYNRVVTELVIPTESTYVRGVLTVEMDQVLRLENNARVVLV